jgi:ribosomal protein L11 methylase PrmA
MTRLESRSGIKRIAPSSFRDPSGFIYFQGGALYRQVNLKYKEDYERLMDSDLYRLLVNYQLLVPHEEADIQWAASGEAYKVIKPELIPFISYPYEWSFSQLKHAALLTLEVQKKSLERGMSLKDCSAYNIQFRRGKPILIDTLSFERYEEGKPWVAYRQFCQHFLAPLALMSYTDIRLSQFFRVYVDGVPLDLASPLLPFHTRLKFSLLSHIHLHARTQKHFANKPVKASQHKLNRVALLGLIDSLESAVQKLTWQPQGTEWANYYAETNYGSDAFQHKKQLVSEFLEKMNPKPQMVWDLGANTGLFSRIASSRGILTISFDVDPACVEQNYLECVRKAEAHILPLLLDLTNPSPNLGWANQERTSLLDRGPADAVLALALIHHLAISNNVPFHKIAEFFSQICHSLIIEFVPKGDSQVETLLSSREDIFSEYTQRAFEREFSRYFVINSALKIRQSERTLYWMERSQG